MEHDTEWPARIAHRVGQQIARLRERPDADGRRMTAQALADRCTELGLPLDRAVIAKLEKGHRATITVGEVMVLAKALGVPPLLLIFPVGQDQLTEVLPGREIPTWWAAKWFAGDEVLPRERHAELGMWLTDEADVDAWNRGGALPIVMYRQHDRLMGDRTDALTQAAAARREAEAAGPSDARGAHLQRAEAEDRRLRELDARLRADRDYMRRNGVEPPELPAHLSHLDQPPE